MISDKFTVVSDGEKIYYDAIEVALELHMNYIKALERACEQHMEYIEMLQNDVNRFKWLYEALEADYEDLEKQVEESENQLEAIRDLLI
jgi:predicted  nucleic acid-binding Zn-ribbon protein